MATTRFFQNNPDFFDDKDICVKSSVDKVQTNPRYKNFKQNNFTAGDEEQFQEYRNPVNGSGCNQPISMKNNIFQETPTSDYWGKYEQVGAESVINTFRYIFNKFKKGVFIKVKDNKLDVFLPFSKASFVNEWSDKMEVDPNKYAKPKDFIKYVTELAGYRFNPRYINENIDQWYGNNCLIRYEFPIQEGDSNIGNVKNMLEELCASRKLPDIELFINRRDFPILTRDGTEAYDNIWGSNQVPLVSHLYNKYIPILSMSNSDRYADITIPTWDDWARVQSKEGIYFPKTCREYDDSFATRWENKKPTAVFRGGTTGCGVTIDTNPRLKAAYLSSLGKLDSDGYRFLDAGISNWNVRPRKNKDSRYLQTIEVKNLPFGLSERLSPEEQSNYKYIIHIEGHVEAFRLSLELSMGSVILMVESQWRLWYSSMLIPYKHFVPVKSDLSDLFEQIKWCKTHDSECKEIAENSKDFYNKYLQKNGILDYMQKTFIDLKKEMGDYLYNENSPLDVQLDTEKKLVESSMNYYPTTSKNDIELFTIPSVGRSNTLLEGVKWVINWVVKNRDFETESKEISKIFSNKLGDITVRRMLGFDFAVKSTKDPKKTKEHMHESFVGLHGTNKVLSYIPNFAYIFGSYIGKDGSYNVISEHIKGMSLFEYIKSPNFDFNEYMFVLVQLSLAIKVAQNTCGLVHYDLTPWNVMLQFSPRPITFNYKISHDKVVKISTSIIPVIIDYGKSHIVHEGVHHGFVNMFKASKVQDIFTMLITSLDSLNRLSPNDFTKMFTIANFMTGNTYRKKPFANSQDLRNFLRYSRKYANLISTDKYELEDLGPMDLVNHILKIDPMSNKISVTNVYIDYMNRGNSTQVYEYITSGTTEEIISSYKNIFLRLNGCTLPQPKNLLFIYYAAQSIDASLKSVRSDMLRYLNKKNIDPAPHVKIADDVIEFVTRFYSDKINKTGQKSIDYNLTGKKELVQAKYTEETFLSPSKIKDMIQKDEGTDMSGYKEKIDYIFVNNGIFRIGENDRKYYQDNLKALLETESFSMMNNKANVKSLRVIAGKIYVEDLTKQLSLGICKNQKYVDEYDRVISQIHSLRNSVNHLIK